MSEYRHAKCDNCEKVFPLAKINPLNQLHHPLDRLSPGAEVPAGDCPECGALCYLCGPEGEDTRHVIIHGNPLDGFQITGPFADGTEAAEHGDAAQLGDWWTAVLYRP
jgi:hypothetical protein